MINYKIRPVFKIIKNSFKMNNKELKAGQAYIRELHKATSKASLQDNKYKAHLKKFLTFRTDRAQEILFLL